MTSGSCSGFDELPSEASAIVDEARRAVLGTVGDTHPHLVPVCFALRGNEIVTAIDDKPKSGKTLRRVANIAADPSVTLLFDRWDEDWTRLGWVMVEGRARIEPPGRADADLGARYEQYRKHSPSGEVIAVTPQTIRWWTWS